MTQPAMQPVKKRGRPTINDKPMTPLEIKRRQREKFKAAGIKSANVTLTAHMQEMITRYCEITGVPEHTHISAIASLALMHWAKDVEKRLPEIAEQVARMNASK